jgi:hypothetical protein
MNIPYAYSDTDVCQWHLNQIQIESTRDFDFFIRQDGKKIAFFHIPFPWNPGHGEIFEDRFIKIKNLCDQVVVIGSELHETTVDFIRRNQQENIKYFICGVIENIQCENWMDWFNSTSIFYKHNPAVLDQLTPYAIKEKTFDILLGRIKPHRGKIYNYVQSNNLADRVIMTYLKGNDNIALQKQDSSGWVWEPGTDLPAYDIKWTVTPVQYQGYNMSISQIIPLSIYNKTAYSVVAETNWDNHYSFYTEKIVKPILAERLFLVFSGQHYLRNLRSLGFKTFDGIIDETYDIIADNNQRFKLACEQITYLCNCSQEEVLAKIRPITEHNKRVMMETDWCGDFAKELRAVLLEHVERN